jgi:hypothetical protein
MGHTHTLHLIDEMCRYIVLLYVRSCQLEGDFFFKALVFKCEIYMYRKEKKKNCEDQSTLTYIIFTCKISLWPLTPKLNCLQIGVYCIQNHQLGHMVSTKQTINWSKITGLGYPTKRAWISNTKPNCQISARCWWYLNPMNIWRFFFVQPKWPPRFFATENYVGQGARIFTIFSSSGFYT